VKVFLGWGSKQNRSSGTVLKVYEFLCFKALYIVVFLCQVLLIWTHKEI
jgi:hypothetical protein